MRSRMTRVWKRGAFNGGEQFILRGALQIPTQGDAAQVRIHQHGAVAVVPGHAQQAGLPGAVVFQSLTQRLHVSSRASCDGVEDVSHCGEAGFDAGAPRMHASLHHATDAGHKVHRGRDADDAGRRADHVHHVVGAAAGADRVPVRVEGTDRNRDAGFQAQLSGPFRRKRSRDLIRSGVFAVELFAHAREQAIDFG